MEIVHNEKGDSSGPLKNAAIQAFPPLGPLLATLLLLLLLCSLIPVSVHSEASEDSLGSQSDHLHYERDAYAKLLFNYIDKQGDELTEGGAYHEAERVYQHAQKAYEQGDLKVALGDLDNVIVILETITTQQPLIERDKQRYQSLKESIPQFITAYQRNQQRVGGQGSISKTTFDQNHVDTLIAESARLAERHRYGEAVVLLREAQDLIAEAIKGMLDNTQIGVVEYELDRSVLGRSKEELQLEQYHDILRGIDQFLAAQQRYTTTPPNETSSEGAPSGYTLIQWLRLEAEGFVKEGRYSEALEIVTHIRDLITQDLRKKLDGKEIVVKLNLDTPEGEYAYERNQYIGYDELIPVALKQMRPSPEIAQLIRHHTKRGHWMAEQAENKFEQGEIPVAIRMMQDAKKAIQTALKAAGVPIYTSP